MDARSNDQVVFLSGQSGETTMSNPSRDPASLNNHRQCFDHTINGPILSDAPLFGSPSTHSTRSNNISITNNNNNDRINRGSRHQRYEPYQRRHTNSSPIKSKPTTKKVSKHHKQAQLFPTLDDLVLPPSPPPTDDDDDKLFFQNPVADDDDVFAEFAGFADFSFDNASFDVDSTPSSEEDFALFP